MNFLFILVFACTTWSSNYLTNDAAINGYWDQQKEFTLPTCTSEIEIVKSEKELLALYSSNKIYFRSPSKIYRLDLKTGEMKSVSVIPIIERKKKMVEQEEQTIKGYEIK